MTNDNRPALISLFCGPGGLDQGFKEAGFITQLAYDKDQSCVDTHKYNHPEARACVADLQDITVEEIVDDWNKRSNITPVGIIGGPPCQSFSVSNRHQRDDDPRHRLPEHYARILGGLNRAFNLDFFVFENVPGLITGQHPPKFAKFKELFRDAGFQIFEASLDAQYFRVAQKRSRVFVVGINQQKYPNFKFNFPKGEIAKSLTVRDTIENLPDPIYYSREVAKQGGIFHPNHWCMAPKSKKFINGNMSPGKFLGRSFRVLAWDKPSYTVAYGHREVHVHPNGHRRLSVYEAMLLQGFPEEYVLIGNLTAQIRLVSEAVAPPVAKALAKSLDEQLVLNALQANLIHAGNDGGGLCSP